MLTYKLIGIGLIITAALGFATSFAHAQAPVRFSVTTNWTMPLAEFSPDGAPQDGVMLKVIRAIGKASYLPWAIVTLPRQRLDDAAEAGEIDVRCYSRPEWTRSPDSYFWSDPIMTHRNLLIGRKGAEQVRSIADLAGRSIATVLGFRYVRLDQFMQSAQVTRHVVPTERNVALMVALGRSEYGFISALTLKYLRPREPALDKVETIDLPQDDLDVHCGVRRTLDPIQIGAVLSAIAYLRASGKFEEILDEAP